VDLYRQVIEALDDRPLVIRTLDLGGDKVPPFLSRKDGANPHFGLRGLRFALDQMELFATQLQAILSVAADHDARVMFPMVLGKGDLRQAVEQLHVAAKETGISEVPPIGAMIETPSALFALPEILELVDFVSIGTNDLTQFMLAADRNATELTADYSVLHPSVLRAIRHVVQTCGQSGRQLCVCGEAAGDAETACLLVGLGVKELSMSPVRAAAVRFLLRRVEHRELTALAERTLAAESAADVRQSLRLLSDR
jgi:phosphoenolpyruvate-protein kinase (PTS system EI component)